MPAQLLDGVVLSKKIRTEIAARGAIVTAKGIRPGLAVIVVGENPASQVYVRNKVKACEDVGFHSVLERYSVELGEEELLARIATLNADPSIHGILVQLPLPEHIAAERVLEAISPEKDIDGFHVANAGALMVGQPEFKPCTPYGCMKILESIDYPIRGARAVIVGASMGGSVSLAFAIAYPKRTKGLGLIDTTAWYGADAPQKWAERASKAVNEGLSALIDFQKTRWFTESFIESHPDEVARLVNTFLANDVQCFEQTCTMLGAFDVRSSLKDINLPTTIIVGEEDYATPVEMSQQMHANIKNSTLNIIPKARHLTPIECSTEINKILAALIAKAYQ
jgi:dienelactone hydrolase